MQRRKNNTVNDRFNWSNTNTWNYIYPYGKYITSFCFILLGFSASGQSIGFAITGEQCKKNSPLLGLGLTIQ